MEEVIISAIKAIPCPDSSFIFEWSETDLINQGT